MRVVDALYQLNKCEDIIKKLETKLELREPVTISQEDAECAVEIAKNYASLMLQQNVE